MVLQLLSHYYSNYVSPSPAIRAYAGQLYEQLTKTYTYYQRAQAEIFVAQARKYVGSVISRTYFLPLADQTHPRVKEFLDQEIPYYNKFFDKSTPSDLNLPYQNAIRTHFDHEHRVFKITLPDGSEVEVTCPLIKSKNANESNRSDTRRTAIVHGNLTTASNNVMWFYPHVSAYINHYLRKDMPPAEFYLLSAYEVRTKGDVYIPETAEIAGFITAEILKQIGKQELTYVTSLGGIYLAKALKYLPKSLFYLMWFDRTTLSITAASGKYWHGSATLRMAKFGGWDVDVEEELRKWKIDQEVDALEYLFTGVEHDSHFKGPSNLTSSTHLNDLRKTYLQTNILDKLNILTFNPPSQIKPRSTHHALPPDQFHFGYLIDKTDKAGKAFFGERENLTQAVMRRAMTKRDLGLIDQGLDHKDHVINEWENITDEDPPEW